MRELTHEELKQVSGGSQPPGQLGYEGQPGNQGGGGGSSGGSSPGLKGYEGQPGNQGG
jgi:bacteriocin-like protein